MDELENYDDLLLELSDWLDDRGLTFDDIKIDFDSDEYFVLVENESDGTDYEVSHQKEILPTQYQEIPYEKFSA